MEAPFTLARKVEEEFLKPTLEYFTSVETAGNELYIDVMLVLEGGDLDKIVSKLVNEAGLCLASEMPRGEADYSYKAFRYDPKTGMAEVCRISIRKDCTSMAVSFVVNLHEAREKLYDKMAELYYTLYLVLRALQAAGAKVKTVRIACGLDPLNRVAAKTFEVQ